MKFVHDSTRPTYLSFLLYREWGRTKCPPDMPVEMQRVNAALGLAGEAAELMSVVRKTFPLDIPQIIDESGDVAFYACWLMDACGSWFPDDDLVRFQMLTVADFRGQDIEAVIQFGRAVEKVKKEAFHGTPGNPTLEIYLGLIAVHRLLKACGSCLSQAILNNIEKLDARYPDGYRDGGGIR